MIKFVLATSVLFGVTLLAKACDADTERTSLIDNKEYHRALENFGCHCNSQKDMCACCDHLDIPKLSINDTACLEAIYLEEELGFSLLFEINDYVWVNKTLSGKPSLDDIISNWNKTPKGKYQNFTARNPPPICYHVPHIETADLCVDFYDLDYHDKVLSGCIQIQAYLADVKIFNKKIGCYKVKL